MEKYSLVERMLIEAGFQPRCSYAKKDGGPGSTNHGHEGVLGKGDSFGNESRADTDWITVNGAHIPLDDSGTAIGGGKLKGKNFSRAKSEKKLSNGSSISRSKPALKSGSDFDKYVREKNLIVLHRGFSAPSDDKLNEYATQLKNGEAPISGENRSALGKGVYFTESKEEAEGYMNRRKNEVGDQRGRTVTAALDVGAKVADQETINALQAKKGEEASALMSKAFAKDTPDSERKKYGEQGDKLWSMDIATYAQSKGYDALRSFDGSYVVMNQGALVIRDDSADS